MNIPDKCDKCGCTPTVDPITDVIDLTQVCGITLGVQLDREHWLCSTCAAEFGGGTDYDEELEELTRGISALCSETESGHAYEPGVVVGALKDVLSQHAQDTSWAFDRLSVLVTAIECLKQGDWENIEPQFAEQIGEQLLHGVALTTEQADALNEH